jgi:hypothetical protein
MSPVVAPFGHGETSELSPLSVVERKWHFGPSGQFFDPKLTVRVQRLRSVLQCDQMQLLVSLDRSGRDEVVIACGQSQ